MKTVKSKPFLRIKLGAIMSLNYKSNIKSQSFKIGKNLILNLMICALILLISGCSDESNTTPNYDAPSNIQVTKVSNGKVQITWDYTTQNANLVYIIARKSGSEAWNETYYETTNDQKLYVDDIPTNSYTVYSYKVKAKETDTEQESFFSEASSYFSEITQPTDLRIIQTSQTQLKLTWKDNVVGEAGYKIDKKIDNGAWVTAYAVLSDNVVEYTDEVNQLYQNISYRIYAFVGKATSPVNEMTFTPTIQIPDNVSLTQVSQTQVKVNWSYSAENPSSFDIQRKIGTNDWTLINTVTGDSRYFIDNLSVEAASIAYRVRSVKDTLYSAYSDVSAINLNIFNLGHLDLTSAGNQIIVKDNYAFIANDYNGVMIFNISNPTIPYLVSNINMPGRTMSVRVDNTTLYMANDEGLMQIYDISNITTPVKLYDDISFPGQGYDIKIVSINFNKYALIAAGNAGLLIVSLENENVPYPVVIKRINTIGNTFKVEFENNLAYLADGSNGIYKYNLSDPLNPILIQHKSSIGTILDIILSDQVLYCARGDQGIALFNKSDISDISDYDTQGYANAIAIDSRNIYIADRDNGFLIANIVNPQAIYSLCQIATSGTDYVNSVYIKNKYAYVVSQNSFRIIQIRP